MATAPFGVRLLVGATVTALEETRKLPQTILTYPMTVASQAAHFVMRFQQNLAELVNKGDETLEQIFPPKDEQPEWATFDEDDDDSASAPAPTDNERAARTAADGRAAARTEGRFALYTTGEPESPTKKAAATADIRPAAGKPKAAKAAPPAIAAELEYESLTLAQLRARLPSLKVADLEALLAHEESTKARAPFQTLLANRITRASAK
jgi:hypothetical protein